MRTDAEVEGVLNRSSRHPGGGSSAAVATATSMTIEQMFLMQTQAVQAIGQTLAAMQQVQQQSTPQPQVQVQMPQVPRDKQVEFMRGHPPVFAHSTDPMDAEDWLCIVEHELHTA
jgi:ABC-type transport system involved in cytochrome bd biosynthesis fused ATPase/permease subunit